MIASEWLKFRSLRSTLLVLAAAVVGMIAFGAIIAFNTRNPAGLDPEDVVASGPLQGYYLGQLLMGALGVLVVSGEYSTGMIRATLAAVPRRVPVLVAKALVFTVVVGVAMVAGIGGRLPGRPGRAVRPPPDLQPRRRQHAARRRRHRRLPHPGRPDRQRLRLAGPQHAGRADRHPRG